MDKLEMNLERMNGSVIAEEEAAMGWSCLISRGWTGTDETLEASSSGADGYAAAVVAVWGVPAGCPCVESVLLSSPTADLSAGFLGIGVRRADYRDQPGLLKVENRFSTRNGGHWSVVGRTSDVAA